MPERPGGGTSTHSPQVAGLPPGGIDEGDEFVGLRHRVVLLVTLRATRRVQARVRRCWLLLVTGPRRVRGEVMPADTRQTLVIRAHRDALLGTTAVLLPIGGWRSGGGPRGVIRRFRLTITAEAVRSRR